jgi:hypothetical protein
MHTVLLIASFWVVPPYLPLPATRPAVTDEQRDVAWIQAHNKLNDGILANFEMSALMRAASDAADRYELLDSDVGSGTAFVELLWERLLAVAPPPNAPREDDFYWRIRQVPWSASAAVGYGQIHPETAIRALGSRLDDMSQRELYAADAILRYSKAYDWESGGIVRYMWYKAGQGDPGPWYDLSYQFVRSFYRTSGRNAFLIFAKEQGGTGPGGPRDDKARVEADAMRAASARVQFAQSLPRSDPEYAQALEKGNAALRQLAESPHPFARFYVATVLHDNWTIFDRSLLKKLAEDEDLFVVKAAEEAIAQESAP